ncbi:MAG: hypothetical protein ACRCS8_00345 [Brevinema sp.]
MPEINRELKEQVGSAFFEKMIAEIFDIEKIRETEEESEDHHELLNPLSWYLYDKSIFTSEEKHLIILFKSFMDKLQKKYTDTYLLRNERFFALYNKKGQRFEPDFVLICKNKDENEVLYQCFIEPKGSHLLIKDKWKEDFLLNELSNDLITKGDNHYKIIGMPFYNQKDGVGENKFEELLEDTFKIDK